MTTNRRNFLKSSLVSMAALPFATQAIARSHKSENEGIELAIASITMDGFGDVDFEKTFKILPLLPFKFVEFNCWYARNLTPSGIQSIKERCEQIEVTPICIQGSSFGTHGNNIIKDVTHKLWNMEAAKKLGCRRVKFTGAGRGAEGGLEAVIAAIKELAPVAKDMDMLVLVENHANNNIETLEDYERIFDAIDSPYVGMCMDNAHFDGARVDLMQVIEKFHSKILHIDLKDTAAMGVHKVVNYGEGVTRNNQVVERMMELGYQGYLLVEMAPPRNEETLVSDLRRAYTLFEKYRR
jgi:sugar phosphate isomerase/epimerase